MTSVELTLTLKIFLQVLKDHFDLVESSLDPQLYLGQFPAKHF